MKIWVVIILLFFFIYNVPFTFLPIATGKIVLVVSLLSLLISIKGKFFSKIFLSPTIVGPFFFIVILVFYSLIINIVHYTSDFTMLYTYFIFLLEYFLGAFLFLKLFNRISLQRKEDIVSVFIKVFITIAVIQACLVYLMLFIPSFKEFSFSILRIDGLEDLNERYGGFRGLGYASSLTYDFAVLQSLVLLLIPYQVIHEKRVKVLVLYLLSYLLITGSVLISGRTGMLGIAISLCLFLYFSISMNGRFFKLRLNFAKLWGLYLLLLVLLIIYYNFLLNTNIKFYIENIIVPYAFEAFISYFETGTLETTSTNVLREMYFPIDIKTFLIGDGHYVDPSGIGFYMSTDAGYMRQILFYGILGSLLLYVFYYKLWYRVHKTNENKDLKLVFSCLLLYLFIVHYKGDILMGGSFVIKFVILFYLIIHLNNIKSERRKENIGSYPYKKQKTIVNKCLE